MPQTSRGVNGGDDGGSGSSGSAPAVSPRAVSNNLPLELSSFVGRGAEVAEVLRLLHGSRLLTLTGPGGSGKTRLALRTALQAAGRFENGVWLVELAPISDPQLVPRAVASALGVREVPGMPLIGTLSDHLRSRSMLLVLDNCEHVVEACAGLSQTLLRSCPDFHILATSREALGVPGEALFAVPPLSLPDPYRLLPAGDLPENEAVRLFVDRASAARPDFTLTSHNAAAVAQVCLRLDGIPLAIELAAARVRMLSVEQLLERLEGSFGLLSRRSRGGLPHHRTLRATMDWSYELLSSEERALLRRLSVFAGGWTIEAAEAACAGEGFGEALGRGEVLDLLSRLVDKSLVLVGERDGEARYRLLETVRQYGREKLDGSGEEDVVCIHHALYYLGLAERAESDVDARIERLQSLDAEHDNLRAALYWALEKREGVSEDHGLGLRLAVALWPFWYTRGYLSEGRGWLERSLAQNPAERSSVRAGALNGAGYIALFQGSYGTAKELFQESLALYRVLGDPEGVASSLIYLGFVAVLGERDLETVPALHEEAMSLRPHLKDPLVLANLLLLSGLISINQGDLERAVPLHQESLEKFRKTRDARGMGHCLNNLAFIAVLRGDYDVASTLLRENLQLARESGYKLAIQYSFLGLGFVADSREQPARAARLWGATEAMEEAFGIKITPIARSSTGYETRVAAARSRLGTEEFEAAWSEGRAMPPEEAIEYALRQPPPAPEQPDAPPSYPAGLSAREVEVLRLVANGMTNARIAKELYISPRTVNAHLGSIYNKIGTHSRAEATRFSVEHGLL